jgi:predicted metal-binding protein
MRETQDDRRDPMLRRPDNLPRLLACIICQRPEDGAVTDINTPRSGSRLLAELKAQAAKDSRLAGLSVEPARCMYNCQRDCSVHLRAPGKPGVMIDHMGTDAGSARAVLDYAAAYLASEDGTVASADQPPALEGRVSVWSPPERYLA